MEKEQVAVDEAVETVAEENTRAYSKTVWNESTPITADKLNKIENGIASALPLTGGTLTGRLYVSGNSKTIGIGTGGSDVFINNSASNKYLQLKDDGTLRYDNNLIYHEGNFNPATKLDAGNFSIHGRDLKIYGKRAMVGHDTADGNHLVINYERDFANGVAIHGLVQTETLAVGEKLTFSNTGGSGLTATINNSTLHATTGNGQMMNVGDGRIFVGNPQTHLTLESSSHPTLNMGGGSYYLYHTGNKPTPWDIGAMSSNAPTFQGNMIQVGAGGRDWIYHINADAGTLHIAPHNNGNNDWDRQIMFDRNGQIFCNGRRKVPTWEGNPTHYMFRYGSGLGGANGYITFSY